MLASFLFVKPAYKNADCILALTNDELNDILNYGVKNVPIAVIPNGINLEEDILISSNYKEELVSLAKDRKVILSLSRLHSSKGIDLLLEAFNTFKNNKNYVLFIVGDGDDAYKKKLKDIIKKYQLENSIFMLGHKGGKEKNTLYEFADLFVLPSYNEGFGLTILEALRQETPVITTTGTPFKELPLRDCGWCVRPEIVAIKEAIEEYDALDYLEISKMKKNGLDWLKTDFDENIIAEKMDVLYTWLVNGGEIPNFVYNGDEIV
jgi:glycosyltransferase involved in cell wall biosynthesis